MGNKTIYNKNEKGDQMTINEFLDLLDYYGITYEDDELVQERLKDFGWKLSDTIKIEQKEI